MWGDPGVTELQIIKDASLSLATTGVTPTTVGQGVFTLQHVGLLRRLRMRLNIPFTTSGTMTTAPTLDVNGPWNLISNFRLDVNGIAPLFVASGIGLYIISVLSSPFGTVEAQTSTSTDPAALTDAFAFPTVTTTPGPYQVTACFDLPFSVDISLPGQTLNLPTELGLWLLQNQTVDAVVTVAFNPLQSSTVLGSPLQGGTPNYTYNAATVDFEREFYRIPSDPANMPILSWAHQWVETFVPFSGAALDLPVARAGILLRAVAYVIDGATNDGVLSSKITAMSWIYGANETPLVIDPGFMRVRQLRDYGRLLPKGCFLFDWYRWTSTPQQIVGSLKLVYNTEAIVNQRCHIDFASAMAAGSYVRFLVERLIPIVANRTASPVATSGAPVGAQQAPVQTG